MVLETAEQLLRHLERPKRLQRGVEPSARRVERGGAQIEPAEPPLRDRIAALVACLPTHGQRARQPLAGLRQIARFIGNLAEQPLALALDLLVLDLAREREARLEMKARACVVVDVHLDLAEVEQPDRLAEPVVER